VTASLDADGVIDSYVHDVARRLPAARRNDVAYELRVLLADDLRERAADAGREPDAALALALLRDFGRPSETAARYHRPFTLVEPSDTWSFVVAAVAGGSVLSLLEPGPTGSVATLAWFGLLLLGSAAKNLLLRRNPDAFAWRPRRVRDLDAVNRPAALASAAALVAAGVVYLWPGPVVEAVTGGRFDPASLAYTADFAGPWRRPWLAALLAVLVAFQLAALVRGRRGQRIRVLNTMFLLCAAVQLGWHVSYGSVFRDAVVEDAVLPFAGGVSGVVLLVCLLQLYREYTAVRPAPATPVTPVGAGPQIQP
jgi:hypothetical protein